jgi:hypothetical protein
MALRLNWKPGVYTTDDPSINIGVHIEHQWISAKKLHQGYVARVGRGRGWWQWWLELGEYQTLYAAQQAVEQYLSWRSPDPK